MTDYAKKQLEELGEDVEDFEVTTTAKMAETIKDLTKVGDQAGVSILDANGNFRSTYEILQEIADVWEQIAEEDLETGQNRQNALLEKMAGKNRANILASILTNPEILRNAYESAVNDSAGSAQDELDKFLDSIDGKITQFQNKFQELQTDFLSSDMIKGAIELGTDFITLLDNIIKRLNELPGPLTQIAEGLTIFGLFTGGKALLSKGTEGTGGIISTLLGVPSKQMVASKYDEIIDLFKIVAKEQGVDLGDFVEPEVSPSTFKQIKDLFHQNLDDITITPKVDVGDMAETASDIADSFDDVTDVVEDVTDSTVGLGKTLKATKSAIKGIFKGAAGATAQFMAWGAVIAAVGAGLYYLYDKFISVEGAARRADEALQKYEEVKKNIESISDELQNNKNIIEEIKALGSLTYTEQEEIDKLQEANELLEIQLELEKQRAELANKEAVDASIEEFQKRYKDGYLGIEGYNKAKEDDSFHGIISKDNLNNQLLSYEDYLERREKAGEQYEDAVTKASAEGATRAEIDEADRLKEIYEGLNSQLSKKETTIREIGINLVETKQALNEAYKEAMSDGVVDSDEQNIVDTYQAAVEGLAQYYKVFDPQKYVENLLDDEALEKTKDQFIEMAQASENGLTSEMISRYDHLNTALRECNMTQEQFCNWINESIEAEESVSEESVNYTEALAEASKNLATAQEAQQQAAETASSAESNFQDMKDNLQWEYEKAEDWFSDMPNGDEYVQKIKNGTLQSIFGNINMDKRQIITWSDEMKKTYADALASWNYDPEVGGIDTVWGGSESFKVDDTEYEITFTPILQTDQGPVFMDSDSLFDYLDSVVAKAAEDGEISTDEILKIDAEGIGYKYGNELVKGMIGAVGDGTESSNMEAVAKGMLMHFAGKFGAVKLAQDSVTTSTTQYTKAARDARAAANELTKAEEESYNALKKYQKNNPIDSLAETTNMLNTQVKPLFDSLGSAYQNIFTEDGFTLDKIDITETLESIRSQIDSLNANEDLSINVDYEDFDNLARVLSDSTSTAEEVQDAFDRMATSIAESCVEATDALAELAATGTISPETADNLNVVKSALEDLGVTAMPVPDILNGTVTQMDIESMSAQQLAQSLALLQLKQALVNDDPLTLTGKTEQILLMARAAGAGTVELEALGNMMYWIDKLADVNANGGSDALKNSIQNRINYFKQKVVNGIDLGDIKLDYKVKPTSSSQSSAKDAGEDLAEKFKEGLQNGLSDVESMISYITDKISDKIDDLNDELQAKTDALDDEIDALNDAKDAAVAALEAERDAALAAIDAEIAGLEAEIDAIEKQQKEIQKVIDAKQDEIDAIDTANKKRQQAIDLQKAEYELARAQQQKTILLNIYGRTCSNTRVA